MLLELSKDQYRSVDALLPAEAGYLEPKAVVQGHNPGWIFADSVTCPKVALIWSQGIEGFYLLGTEVARYGAEINRLIDSVIMPRLLAKGAQCLEISSVPPVTDAELKAVFQSRELMHWGQCVYLHREGERTTKERATWGTASGMVIAASSGVASGVATGGVATSGEAACDVAAPGVAAPGVATCNVGTPGEAAPATTTPAASLCEIKHIWGNPALKNPEFARGKILDYWETMDAFNAHGDGYCIIINGTVASLALTGWMAGGTHELSIETLEAYRRRGFAKACAAALVDCYLQKGYVPYWECEATNTASARIAQSLGFTKLYDYTCYGIPIPED